MKFSLWDENPGHEECCGKIFIKYFEENSREDAEKIILDEYGQSKFNWLDIMEEDDNENEL